MVIQLNIGVKMETAKQIVNSEQYKNLINIIKKKTRFEILSEYRDIAAERDEQKMKLANLSINEALRLLEEEKIPFSDFVLLKMQKFENVKIDEEYPDDEEPEQENDNEEILGYSKGFLLIYLIEYFLLKTNSSESELGAYLKITRIPNAKKYEKELREIYEKI